jgi:putative flippase GtrA
MASMSKLLTAARMNRKEAERFGKFMVVGALGAVVDFGLFNLLHGLLNIGLALAQTCSFATAVMSNFTWNRAWTYRDSRSKPVQRQLVQFFAVNLIGFLIRTPILLFTAPLYTRLLGWLPLGLGGGWEKLGANLGLATAVTVVMLWNFFINRLWTYNDVA